MSSIGSQAALSLQGPPARNSLLRVRARRAAHAAAAVNATAGTAPPGGGGAARRAPRLPPKLCSMHQMKGAP